MGESRQFPGAGSSLRSGAGLEDERDESCGGDAEDELAPELDDNPGTTRGRSFPFCIKSSYLVWLGATFDRWPTHKYIYALRGVSLAIKTAGVSSSICTVTKRSRS